MLKDIESRVHAQYDLVNNLVIDEIDGDTFSISGEGMVIPNGDAEDRGWLALGWAAYKVISHFARR